MGNVVTLKGTLLAGPPKASTGTFPPGLFQTAFELTPANKSADVQTSGTPNVNSPSDWVELGGVGDEVTQATFLYVRTIGKMKIRLTTAGDSGDEVVILYVQGVHIHEFPPGNYLKLLEARGVGVVEYYASGTQ